MACTAGDRNNGNCKEKGRAMDEELLRIYEDDQADRRGHPLTSEAQERDRQRRQRVQELIEAGALADAPDYFHAAVVFQHGEHLDDFWRVYELARRSMDLGNRTNLAALAYDRWLMHQGKPQKFGSQSRLVNGRYVMWKTDPATTDAKRAAWHMPPLAKLQRQVDACNRDLPPPSADAAR